MNHMLTEEEGSYSAEYNDVIAQISIIVKKLQANQKAGKTVEPINEFQVVEICPRIVTLSSEYR